MEETKPVQNTEPKREEKKKTGMAAIAYIIFFIPLLTQSKDDPFVKFHVKQGLVLFLLGLAFSLVRISLPVTFMIAPLLSLVTLVLTAIGIMNALNGNEKKLPFIGQFADKFNF